MSYGGYFDFEWQDDKQSASFRGKSCRNNHRTMVLLFFNHWSLMYGWFGELSRSYYRCSSLKGCLARKQVERSQSDPQMFVITYTAEHCHGHPIRKSSLAGTTRHKFSLPKRPTTSNHDASISTDSGSCSLSPPVTPVLAMKVEDGQRISDIEASKSNIGVLDDMCDVMLCDDLFLGFDELDRLDFWF